MDVLSVSGKDYVKASVIARDLGYTADYVGQLCRSHKVNAKLVGRSWYVERGSIHDHKANRYRSTQTKSKEQLKEVVHLKAGKSESGVFSSNFYSYTPPAKVSYLQDDSELIPVVGQPHKKTGSLKVDLADATVVDVVSKNPQYTFQTPELPEIRFKGSLTVTNVEEEKIDTDEGAEKEGKHIHPKDTSSEKTKNKAKNIDSSSVTITISETSEADTPQAVSKQLQQPLRKTIPVTAPQDEADMQVPADIAENSSYGNKITIAVSAVVSLVIALAFVGLEANVWVTQQSMTTTYEFGIGPLTASAYDAFENIRSTFYVLEFSTSFFIF